MSDYSASPEFRKVLGPAHGAAGLARRDIYSAGPYVDGSSPGAAPAASSFTLGQYWNILARRKGTVLLIALLGAGAAFLLTRMQTPVYRARTLLEIESLNEDFLNTRNVNPTSGRDPFQSPEYMIRTQTMILQSRPVMERTLGKMDIEKRLLGSRKNTSTLPWSAPKAAKPETVPPREQALTIAASGFKVRAEPNTRVLEATFDSTDPRLAADFVNSIAGAFAEQNRENRWQSSQNISKWLTQQLADVKAKLEADEDALQRYANASSLTFLSDKNTAAEERLRQLQLDLLKAQGDRVAKQSAYELAKAAPA